MKNGIRKTAIERLLLAVASMASQQGASAVELAERSACSTKTIMRDRDFLRDRLHLNLELLPGDRTGRRYRWRASNAEAVAPLVETLAKFNV